MDSDSALSSSRERAKAARSAGVLGVGVLVARALGLIRDIVVAYFLGTGHVADAWMAAFRIPNMLRWALTEGSLNSAFVPVFNEYLVKRSRAETKRLLGAALFALFVFLLAVTLLGSVGAPIITRLIAPGFGDVPGKIELTAHLLRWTFFYLFFLGLAALLTGVLQSLGHFFTAAASAPLFNIVLIASMFTICPLFPDEPEQWINGLLIGALIAGFLQLAIQVPPLIRRGMFPRPNLQINHPGVQRIGKLILPTLLGVAVIELGVVATTLLASLLGEGAIAAFEYSTRVVQVPYAIGSGALSAAILPLLSRQVAHDDMDDFKKTLSRSLRILAFLMVPCAVLITALAVPIVRLLLERGAFTADSTSQTALAMALFTPTLIGGGALRLVTSAFFALQDTRTPVKVSVVTLVANVLFALLLMKPLGVGGLALGAALAPCVGSLVLVVLFVRRTGALPMDGWGRSMVATLLGSVGMIGAVVLVDRMFAPAWSTLPTIIERVADVGAPALAGTLVYVGVAYLIRSEDLRFIDRVIIRRQGV